MGGRRRWIDRLLDPSATIIHTLEDNVVDPAWKRVTEGESSIPAIVAIGVAVVLEATLAARSRSGPVDSSSVSVWRCCSRSSS